MPRVTVFCSIPSADPIATTSWPTRTVAADPSGIVAWPADGFAILSSATSKSGAVAATRADSVVPSERRIVTDAFPVMTCTLVSSVSGATKKPLPVPALVSTRTTAGIARATRSSSDPAAVGAGAVGEGAPRSASARRGGAAARRRARTGTEDEAPAWRQVAGARRLNVVGGGADTVGSCHAPTTIAASATTTDATMPAADENAERRAPPRRLATSGGASAQFGV